ncbi:MAG TPA: cobyric acid synthase [Caldilineaceae bacterium]|nr:cobyric acid synthase [Caldilineaceae bacterium]
MAKALMLLGTHSNAGKSLLATALCRILARRGVRVAPFKAQNMSNNAGVTPEGGEMGRAQIVQAEAAGIAPHTDMNPVLLKPEGDRRSQVVLNGRVWGHLEARHWLEIKKLLWDEVRAAYDRLAARYEVIVLEGAGSPAEINLKAGDIANLRMARYAHAPCLLIGDIDRGGVFAALAGTLLLLEPDERRQIAGFLINKFRGDPSLLGDALAQLQARAFGIPTLGIIPYIPDLRVASEDAVVLEDATDRTRPSAQTADAGGEVEIAVIHLPHIANFDEFDALAAEPGVRLRYVRQAVDLGQPAAVILPGTKATLADLAWLRAQGLDRAVLAAAARGAAVVGICGGYQLLGRWLADPTGVEAEPGTSVAGLGLLPVATEFAPEKTTHRARLRLAAGGEVTGYEIHTGQTVLLDGAQPLGWLVERSGQPVTLADGAQDAGGRIWGAYLHGILEDTAFRRRWLATLGWQAPAQGGALDRAAELDRLADVVEAAVDWPQIAALIGR